MVDDHDDIITIYENFCKNLIGNLQDVVNRSYTCIPSKDGNASNTGQYMTNVIDNLDLFKTTLLQWRSINDDFKNENKILNLTVQELKISSNARKNCIQQYKENLSSQYVLIENMRQQNQTLQNSLIFVENKLNQSQKSEDWFKNQLNLCQIEKNKLICRIVELEDKYKQIELNQKNEIKNEELIIKVEKYNEKNTDNKKIQTCDDYPDNSNLMRMYDMKFEEINEENAFLKKTVQEIKETSSKDHKIISEMEGKCLVFQKSIEQNNSIIEMLEHFRKDLCEKLQDSTENAKNKNRKILELMEKNNKLQIELHGQKLEKENLETTARKINEKFVEMRNIQEKLIASLNDKDTVISDLHSEKDKLSEENKRCRSLEFEYKRKIVELQKNLENMDIEKQDLAAVHYDELCEYSRKMKGVERRMVELENDLMDKISAVSKLEVLLMQKEQLTLELSERSTKSECLLKEAMSKIESLEKEIRNLISNLNKNLFEINKLKEEKYQLQHCLNQREKLLAKVFQAFKIKIQEAVNEANNKFFLQRLCSDLKSALKIYMEQNKILRENFQNRSVELGDQYIKKSGKYSEKYIRALLKQQEDFSNVRESFGDVQVFLDSIKKELCCVQEKLVGLV